MVGVVSVMRVVALHQYYHAPLKVYARLEEISSAKTPNNVCIGKEWHRFPSNFFVPANTNVKFIKSLTKTVLPKPFKQDGTWSGIWEPAHGFNNKNELDPDLLVL